MNKLVLIEGNPQIESWVYKFYKEYESPSGNVKPVIDKMFKSKTEMMDYINTIPVPLREDYYVCIIDHLLDKVNDLQLP